jgi:hypothetical protein
MSDFHDPALRDRLNRYAAAPLDGEAALVGVQQRVRQVKRRRAAIWGSTAVIVIGLGAANALEGPSGTKVTIATASEIDVSSSASTPSASSSTSMATTTSAIVETTSTVAETTVAETTGETLDDSSGSGSGSNSGSGSGTRAPRATNPPVAPATPAPAPAAQTSSTSGIGGTLSVRLADGALSIVSATPNGGYSAEVTANSATKIRVSFVSNSATTQITATVADGAIRFSIDERSDDETDDTGGGDGTRPSTTVEDSDDTTDDSGGDGGGSGGGSIDGPGSGSGGSGGEDNND